jgi:hypothetical protein
MQIDPKVEGPTRTMLSHVIRDELEAIPTVVEKLGDERFGECVELCVVLAGYVTIDVLGPEWPTDAGLRELAKGVARAQIDVDLDESRVHEYLRKCAIGSQPIDSVFTSAEDLVTLPVVIAAALLLAFHPRDLEIWAYLDAIEEALEIADSVKPSAYPAMILAAHKRAAERDR